MPPRIRMHALHLPTRFLLICLAFSSGCTLLEPDAGRRVALDVGGDSATPLEANPQTKIFQRIKQAKSQNAIVLQIEGDAEPIRVLPLPPEGQSVNVSDLLEQTEVQRQVGRMQVRIYRDSPQQMDGIRMDVSLEGNRVKPESDYALRPGDRILVRKDDTSVIDRMLDGVLPRNAARAFGIR